MTNMACVQNVEGYIRNYGACSTLNGVLTAIDSKAGWAVQNEDGTTVNTVTSAFNVKGPVTNSLRILNAISHRICLDNSFTSLILSTF